jgi:uncharacterized protein YuzE
MRIRYSKDVDMLYVSLVAPKGRVATVENSNGDLIRIDTVTGGIIGVNVQLFMYRIGKGESIEIPEVGFSSATGIGHAFVENIRVQAH